MCLIQFSFLCELPFRDFTVSDFYACVVPSKANMWGKWVLNGVHAVQETFGIERGCKKHRIEQHGVFFLTGLQRATWRDRSECSSKSLAWAQTLCSPIFIAFVWTHSFRLSMIPQALRTCFDTVAWDKPQKLST